jgi:nickel transport protein
VKIKVNKFQSLSLAFLISGLISGLMVVPGFSKTATVQKKESVSETNSNKPSAKTNTQKAATNKIQKDEKLQQKQVVNSKGKQNVKSLSQSSEVESAQVLTEKEITEKLSYIPVFTITNSKGSPLIATEKVEGQDRSLAGAFTLPSDAQAFIDNLKDQDLRVTPISLAEAYKMNAENAGNKQGIVFSYISSEEQSSVALDMLKQKGNKINADDKFQGIPLFISKLKDNKGYITIEKDGKQVIPIFFEKAEVESLTNRFKQKSPEKANLVEIDVTSLEVILGIIADNKDPIVKDLFLIPDKAAIDYVAKQQTKVSSTKNN